MNLRRALHSLMALTLFATSGLAHGQAAAGPSVGGAVGFASQAEVMSVRFPLAKVIAEDRAENTREVLAGRKALDAVKWGGHQVMHSAQTLMLLWTLAAIEGIKREHHLAPLYEKSADWQDVVLRSGDSLINRTGLYASMVGGGVTGVAAGYPLAKAAQAIHAAVPNVFTAKLLSGAVGSFVTFVGWEAGSRLWDEAIYNLSINDTGVERTAEEQTRLEADLKIAQNLRIFDLARGVGTEDEKRVFAAVMNNVFELLTLTHPERTANWIANTLRLNVLNGEFITIVSTMTVAGTVAGSFVLNPWLGAAAGFAGGLAGGFAAHFVPEKNKQRVTDTFRNIGRQAAGVRLGRNAYALEQLRSSLNFQGDQSRPFTLANFDELLAARVVAREGFGTGLFTQIYDSATRFQEADLNAKMARQLLTKGENAQVLALKAEFEKAAFKARGRTEKFLNTLLAFYAGEEVYLESFFGTGDTASVEARSRVDAHLTDVRKVTEMLKYVYAGIFPDAAGRLGLTDVTADTEAGVTSSANIFLNQFNIRGFEEGLLYGHARGS